MALATHDGLPTIGHDACILGIRREFPIHPPAQFLADSSWRVTFAENAKVRHKPAVVVILFDFIPLWMLHVLLNNDTL